MAVYVLVVWAVVNRKCGSTSTRAQTGRRQRNMLDKQLTQQPQCLYKAGHNRTKYLIYLWHIWNEYSKPNFSIRPSPSWNISIIDKQHLSYKFGIVEFLCRSLYKNLATQKLSDSFPITVQCSFCTITTYTALKESGNYDNLERKHLCFDNRFTSYPYET